MYKTAVVAVGVAVLLGAGVAAAQDGGEANATLSSGEEISVLVSAQQTEVRTTIENNAFEIAFERDGARAIENRAGALEDRLEDVEERKKELEREREEEEISEGRYRAKMAKLNFEAEAVSSSANLALEKAEGLERAEERGINVERLRRLKRNASGMTGPEIAEIARGIGGSGERSENAEPPEGVGGDRDSAGRPGDTPGRSDGDMTGGENATEDNAPNNYSRVRDGERDAGRGIGNRKGTDGNRGGAQGRR